MDIINNNTAKISYEEFKSVYKKLIDIKKTNITTEEAEEIIKLFEISYKFILNVMEKNIDDRGAALSLPKYLLIMAAKNNLIDDLEMWMRFYDIKNKLTRNEDNIHKGKVVFNIIKILPIFRSKVDELIRLFENKNQVVVR